MSSDNRCLLVPARGPAFRQAQWTILLTTMFCDLFYDTGRQSFGFAIPGLERELGIGKAALGWTKTSMLWSYALGQELVFAAVATACLASAVCACSFVADSSVTVDRRHLATRLLVRIRKPIYDPPP